MWISDNVKLDDELLTAQQNGKLVIFAGAGVSIAPPSNFPDFANLANKVNNIAGKPLHFDREEPIDRFLGKLKKQDINVHRIVQRELMDPESRPTELHSSILSIFKDPKEIKIVTTNFDIHFSTAASHMSLNIPIYKAPALPLGRDFNGIIYLHGSVEQAPQ